MRNIFLLLLLALKLSEIDHGNFYYYGPHVVYSSMSADQGVAGASPSQETNVITASVTLQFDQTVRFDATNEPVLTLFFWHRFEHVNPKADAATLMPSNILQMTFTFPYPAGATNLDDVTNEAAHYFISPGFEPLGSSLTNGTISFSYAGQTNSLSLRKQRFRHQGDNNPDGGWRCPY